MNALCDSIMAADSVITEEFVIHQLSDRDNLDKTKGKGLAQKAAENPNSLDATEWFIWRRTAIVKQSKKRTMRRKDTLKRRKMGRGLVGQTSKGPMQQLAMKMKKEPCFVC